MAGAIDALREILALTENVRALQEDVERLTTYVDDLRDRLARIEEREEIIVEKTRNAAIMAVNRMNGDLIERLVTIELALKLPRSRSVKSKQRRALPETSAPDSEDGGT